MSRSRSPGPRAWSRSRFWGGVRVAVLSGPSSSMSWEVPWVAAWGLPVWDPPVDRLDFLLWVSASSIASFPASLFPLLLACDVREDELSLSEESEEDSELLLLGGGGLAFLRRGGFVRTGAAAFAGLG